MKSSFKLALFLIHLLGICSTAKIAQISEKTVNLKENTINNQKGINSKQKASLLSKNNANSNSNNNSNKLMNKMRYKSLSSTITTNTTGNSALVKTKVLLNTKAKDDSNSLWNQLFSQERESICRVKQAKGDNLNVSSVEIKRGERVYKGSFSWIKKWGYGPSAYLIDFLDPVFFNDITRDFSRIYKEIHEVPNKDNDMYEDVFELRKLDPTNKITDLKKLNPNYESGIYENSINSVQLDYAMRNWGWFKVDGEDSAKQMILEFDINGDGRLTPREFILGLIMHHKGKRMLCYNCLLLLKKKLSALFEYFDCGAEGFITAEVLWRFLPQLNRDEKRWNIFGIANENNIRTDCVNDFVIKNGETRPGFIAKEEFVNGILLAYWDRQTNNKEIIDNDSRSLKKLRWKDNEMVDTVAFEYMKDKELAEKIAEEEKQNEFNQKAAFKDK